MIITYNDSSGPILYIPMYGPETYQQKTECLEDDPDPFLGWLLYSGYIQLPGL